MYCLVVTEDYSRFSWVFLATKDETSEILKAFIIGIENLIDHKVKIIRCDNGTEFKNKEMNQFYEKKGINREFTVARTLKQNGVAERKNKTLIETARTMLADSKLPTTFWAKAVNIACYVQNRADEGFFVGYSVNSKAFRVFNSRIEIVKKTLHIIFLENKPNVAGSGPTWLFDIDTLTKYMNYKPVVAGNQSNGSADPLLSSSSKDSPGDRFKPSGEEEKKDAKNLGNKDNEVLSTEKLRVSQEKDSNVNNTNNINTVSPTANVAGIKDNAVDKDIVYGCADDPNMTNLEEIVYSDEDKDVGAEADMTNLDTNIPSAFLYGRIEEEVYVCQPPGFEDPEFPDRVYKVEKALYGLYQAPRAWKEMCIEFKKMMHKKFQMSSMRELTFFLGLAPIETSKPLLKDENTEDVDVYLYRSMTGSLMYLTSSRPDIMFVVCACARFQVTPKFSHLHAVKRIFRYLKGQTKLGLCRLYTNDDWNEVKQLLRMEFRLTLSSKPITMSTPKFAETYNLVAFLEKPTESEGFEQIIDFLNANPIKYALTVNPIIYTSCIKQFRATAKVNTINGEEQIQALVDKKKMIITKTSVRSDLQLEDDEATEYENVTTTFNDPLLSGSSRRIKSLDEASLGDQKDASKQKRIIDNLDADEGVTLVDETQWKNDQDMFDTGVLDDEEVVAEKEVSTADPVTTVGEVVTTSAKPMVKEPSVPVSAASTSPKGKIGGRANLHRTFIQYVRINIEAYESSTPMRKMKSRDAGVKNSILTLGGDKKRRHHRISGMRKKNSDNICEENIMAIRKG
nr:hypothetical protein [Tanacetum cinerariifolium]